jgi:hypothetical protein
MCVAYEYDTKRRGPGLCSVTGRTFYGAVAALPVPCEGLFKQERGRKEMCRWTDVLLEGWGCADLTVMRVEEDDKLTPRVRFA